MENYRSTPEVLEAAAPVIEKNPGGCRRLRPNRPSGPAVRMVRSPDAFSEGVFLAKEIGRMTGGVDMLEAQALGHERTVRAFSDIAVLCRTHRQLELVEKCLRHDDIPCVVSGREDFLEDRQVRGVLAFFRSLQSPADPAALETALGLLWDCPADLAGRAPPPLDAGGRPGGLGGGGPRLWPSGALAGPGEGVGDSGGEGEAMETGRGLGGAVRDLAGLGEAAEYGGVLPSLPLPLGGPHSGGGGGCAPGCGPGLGVRGCPADDSPRLQGTGVSCRLCGGTDRRHASLEMPGRPADLEEERRLLYVGMTRAREELILSAGGGPSPFLDSLPQGVAQEQAGRRQERRLEQLSLF